MSSERSAYDRVVRALVFQVLAGSLLFFGLLGCAGFLPPWYVSGLIVAGALGVVVCHTLKYGRVPIVIGCVVVLLAVILCLSPVVYIRPAPVPDKVHARYFGAPNEKSFTARNFAVVDGTFTLKMWVNAELFHVADGHVQPLNKLSVGRSPNQVPPPHWMDMRITLAMVRSQSRQGAVTQLGSWGQSRGSGDSREIATTVNPVHSHLTSGFLLSGQSRILFVEGDSPFELRPGMTVESFAAANPGQFYVVFVGLR